MPKNPCGRPKFQFDVAQVEPLGRLYVTPWEMATLFGCSQSTMEHLMVNKTGEFFLACD